MAKRWYSVSVLSNFEKKIAEQIRQSVEEQGLEDQIDEVLVPTEEVIEVRRGKKVSTERRFMPGYVLVHMEMSDRGYHLITEINRVTGFLGPQGRPQRVGHDGSQPCRRLRRHPIRGLLRHRPVDQPKRQCPGHYPACHANPSRPVNYAPSLGQPAGFPKSGNG